VAREGNKKEVAMTLYRFHRISCLAVCAIIGLFSSTTASRAQVDFGTPPTAEALSTAAKASPELVDGLARELGSTPEQAAGAAGLVFGIAKSLLKPEDFAAMAKAVPGMDALLAASPTGLAGSAGSAASPKLTFTPGIASSSSSTPGMTTATSDGMTTALSGLSKLGIKPEMIAKAIPFLSGYLKKYGGAKIGEILGGLFKTGK
jgi:hypothetical protein